MWRGGLFGEKRQLAACYQNALALAKALGCESVAFPLISAATNGYPKAKALRVAVEAITGFCWKTRWMSTSSSSPATRWTVSEKLFQAVEQYIDDVYVGERYDAPREMQRRAYYAETAHGRPGGRAGLRAVRPRVDVSTLAGMLGQVDESFGKTVLRKIDEKGMTDVECYKRANIDRRLFNKIKNDPGYRPGKQTALAIAIALKLTLAETKELLMKAGFALSHSNKADIVVEYCIQAGLYDIFQINELLFKI